MRPIIAIFLFLLINPIINVFSVPPQKKPKFRVVGYLPNYRINQVNTSWLIHLTDLIYFSIEPNELGELDLGRIDQSSFKELRDITRKNKVRFSVCVGGWGRSQGFSAMALNKDLRQHFIRQLKNFCLQQKLDGIDFDWEFPQNKEEENAYERLLIETQSVFSQHRLLVTIAVSHHTYLSPSVYKAIDYIHLMSYDHPDQHSTYQDSLSDIAKKLESGVALGKLCLGIPFYGRSIQNWHRATTYADLVEQFHPLAESNIVGGIYFNGQKLVRRKVQYALQKKLAGIMVWEIGQDTVDQTSLLKTISQTLNE